MAFYGCDFIFDGKRASTVLNPNASPAGQQLPYKKLMLYNIGSYGQDDVDFSVGEIVEDRIGRRYDSLLYGLRQNEPLVFTLVFGIDPDDLRGETYLTRTEIAKVTEWLTGHQEYKILRIVQADMYDEHQPEDKTFRYHAMVTGLKLIADGGLPVAFSAEFTCDSPFAYQEPVTYTVSGSQLSIDNRSTTNGYYYPTFTATLTFTGESTAQSYHSLTIVNESDDDRTMRIGTSDHPIPAGEITITIDCQNQIITTNTGVNLYPGFNMKFLRLIPGQNNISITTDGTGTIATTCEYPVNIGA